MFLLHAEPMLAPVH